ncbi:MalY/PatB family protein [Sporosarcina sp. HYO08]|uniref:MalY/PatB family protein n=1 Tax=Sporosarcina sp. HYO08 TaxID=1759557 RepID=UPI0007912C58|nr:MalY/PatB family protein [Sporosarcina sp. HYO08]KXH86094.1 cystathionine beta-lyase [Sporosarcina sp. HYO08]
MNYDFNKSINRLGTSSAKWDSTEELFGEMDLLPLWVADMDFKVPNEVLSAIQSQATHGIFGYTAKMDGYYDAVISWMRKRHQWKIKKEWICSSPGVVPALSLIVQAFSQPGDKIIVQPPVYYPFMKVIESHERQVVFNPLQYKNDRYEMDFEDLISKIDDSVKMLFLCNPHNPGGRVWTKEELVRLGDICLAHNILVISDEIHSDLVFKPNVHTPFAAISEAFSTNSISCTAPSKTFNLAGLQSSNIIIQNESLREKFNVEIDKYFLGLTNTFGVIATEAAYNFGEQWLEECLDYVEGNLHFITEYFKTRLPSINVLPLEATYLAWIDCRELGLTAEELETLLLSKAKVALNQGYTFGPGGEGFVRMNLACPRHIIEKAVKQMEEAILSVQAKTVV